MTELLVGTKKGLFVLKGEPGGGFEITSRHFAGEPVEFAARDQRLGQQSASRNFHDGIRTSHRGRQHLLDQQRRFANRVGGSPRLAQQRVRERQLNFRALVKGRGHQTDRQRLA